jgi:hypothetical protein
MNYFAAKQPGDSFSVGLERVGCLVGKRRASARVCLSERLVYARCSAARGAGRNFERMLTESSRFLIVGRAARVQCPRATTQTDEPGEQLSNNSSQQLKPTTQANNSGQQLRPTTQANNSNPGQQSGPTTQPRL